MQKITRIGVGFPPRFGLFFVIMLTVFLSVVVIRPSGAHASGEVALTWQRNPETSVIGYRVYYGYSSGNYSYRQDVGNRRAYTLKDLKLGKTCYIAVAAYDFYDNESMVSEEVCYTPPAETTLGTETGTFAPTVVFTVPNEGQASDG